MHHRISRKNINKNLKRYSIHSIGVDEVGRGALAGPVVACACFFLDKDFIDDRINDSKKISKINRRLIFDDLLSNPNFIYEIGIISNKMIDKINILNSTMLAMQIAINKLLTKNNISSITHIIIDGNKIPNNIKNATSIIKGDQKYLEIAAASIVAKEIRDKMMIDYANKYNKYGFNNNVGYGTKLHIESIQKFGITEIHRSSFLSNILKIDS